MSKAVVISIDSLFTSDIDYIKELPNFKRILNDSSIVKNINCIYPTLTYPCHTSIITGVYPNKHKISHNEKFQPYSKTSDWYWYSKDIGVDSIIDIAKANNLKTSTILWPVSGGCNADYNIAEIWTKEKDEDLFEVFNNSSTKELMETIYPKYSHIIKWNSEPHLDEFGVCCAEDIITTYKPDLMLIHLAYLDHTRHKFGLFNKEVEIAFDKYDEWLGRIINSLEKAGVYEETNFIILGDHGQIGVNKLVSPNVILKDKGFIKVDENGELVDYKAMCHSSGISTQVMVKDKSCIDELYKLLCEMSENEKLSIDYVFTKEECKKLYNLDCDAEFVIEGKEGTAFSNDILGEVIKTTDCRDYKYSVATHGHLPHKGDKPPFIAKGPNIRKNICIDGANLVDEAPTIMKIFGIEMENIDGEALDILKETKYEYSR